MLLILRILNINTRWRWMVSWNIQIA